MSQRGRPGSAQSLADQQRMPFAAAEALLWGKKTAEEHHYIESRMRKLEEHHRAYDTRIQATEAVAEAAEAATARLRRIEQQVAAIESDEQDRPFDKWVEGELSAFKMFVEKNKTVRQKQIELETRISGLEESVDKAKDVAVDLEILLERISRLESERTKDSKIINKLESDVAELTVANRKKAVEAQKPRATTSGRLTPKHMRPPPSAQPVHQAEDAADETEDEETLPTGLVLQPEPRPVQTALSSMTVPNTSTDLPSPHKRTVRDEMSSRLRMMQRKSIHDPKYTREDDHWMRQGPEFIMNPPTQLRHAPLPATQVVERSEAPSPMYVEEHMRSPAGRRPAKQLVVKLSVWKRKIEEVETSPRLTRSQAKKLNGTIDVEYEPPNRKKNVPATETQIVDEPVAKRRKPNLTRPTPRPRPKAKEKKQSVQAGEDVAKVMKTYSREAVAPNGYIKSAEGSVQQATQVSSKSKKSKTAKPKTVESPTMPGRRIDAEPEETRPPTSKLLDGLKGSSRSTQKRSKFLK